MEAILSQNVFLHAHDAFGIFHVGFRDVEPKGLELRRRDEPGIHVCERAEGANHQPRADQQDQRQRHLDHHQRVARTDAARGFRSRTSALAQPGFRAHARVLQGPG